MATVIDSGLVAGRRAHTCESCRRTIPRGERHHVTKSVDYYGWLTWRACVQCTSLASDLWDVDERGEDEDGNETYAYLPDVDWTDVRLLSPLWAERADKYLARWHDGEDTYPQDAAQTGGA